MIPKFCVLEHVGKQIYVKQMSMDQNSSSIPIVDALGKVRCIVSPQEEDEKYHTLRQAAKILFADCKQCKQKCKLCFLYLYFSFHLRVLDRYVCCFYTWISQYGVTSQRSHTYHGRRESLDVLWCDIIDVFVFWFSAWKAAIHGLWYDMSSATMSCPLPISLRRTSCLFRCVALYMMVCWLLSVDTL